MKNKYSLLEFKQSHSTKIKQKIKNINNSIVQNLLMKYEVRVTRFCRIYKKNE